MTYLRLVYVSSYNLNNSSVFVKLKNVQILKALKAHCRLQHIRMNQCKKRKMQKGQMKLPYNFADWHNLL